jgi:hypothetical protein
MEIAPLTQGDVSRVAELLKKGTLPEAIVKLKEEISAATAALASRRVNTGEMAGREAIQRIVNMRQRLDELYAQLARGENI